MPKSEAQLVEEAYAAAQNMRRHNRAVREQEIRRAARLYRTTEFAAEALGISDSAFRRQCRELGANPPPVERGRRKK